MSLSKQLKAAGFKSYSPTTGEGDFELEDIGGGQQVITRWDSDEPCPFPELLRTTGGKIIAETPVTAHPAKAWLREDWKERRLPNELPRHDFRVKQEPAPDPEPAPIPDWRDEELERLRIRNAELEREKSERAPPSGGEAVVSSLEAIKERLDAVRAAIPEEIRELMEEGEDLPTARRRLTEKLNAELADLKLLRERKGEDLNREAEIEKLLGLFARVGEI